MAWHTLPAVNSDAPMKYTQLANVHPSAYNNTTLWNENTRQPNRNRYVPMYDQSTAAAVLPGAVVADWELAVGLVGMGSGDCRLGGAVCGAGEAERDMVVVRAFIRVRIAVQSAAESSLWD